MNSDKFDAILLNLIRTDDYRVLVDNVAAEAHIRNGHIIVDVFEPVCEIYDLSNATEFTATKSCIGCRLSNGEWHEFEFVKNVELSELFG